MILPLLAHAVGAVAVAPNGVIKITVIIIVTRHKFMDTTVAPYSAHLVTNQEEIYTAYSLKA